MNNLKNIGIQIAIILLIFSNPLYAQSKRRS